MGDFLCKTVFPSVQLDDFDGLQDLVGGLHTVISVAHHKSSQGHNLLGGNTVEGNGHEHETKTDECDPSDDLIEQTDGNCENVSKVNNY